MTDYAHPETVVSTDWIAQHGSNPGVVLVEVDVDTSAYDEGHIAGAVGWNWKTQLCDTVRRDVIGKAELEELLSSSGISNKQRFDHRSVRRQQQLVRRLGVLATQTLRPRRCEADGRGSEKVARRKQTAFSR